MEITTNGELEITSPAPRTAWEEILSSNSRALIYQTPRWTDAVCAAGDYEDASRFYEAPGGKKFVLPLLRQKTAILPLAKQASMPSGCGQGGLLSNVPLHCEAVETILRDVAHQPALSTILHPDPQQTRIWESCIPSEMHPIHRNDQVLDLAGGFETVWAYRFSSTTRRKVRKAESSNLQVEWDSSGKFIPVFYHMYLDWSLRRAGEKRLPAWLSLALARRREPLHRLQAIARVMGDACRYYVAFLDGQAVASAIFLVYGEHAFYWRGTSLREEATPVRANDLIQTRMIQAACEAGCRYYHMGESGGVASLERWKSGFGAAVVPYVSYSIERLPVSRTAQFAEGMLRRMESKLLHNNES